MGSALTVRGRREIRRVERTRDADFRPRLHWRGASRQHWTSRRSHRLQIRLRRAGPEVGSAAAPLARLGCPAGAQDSGRSDLHARAVADRQRGNFRCAVCASGLGSADAGSTCGSRHGPPGRKVAFGSCPAWTRAPGSGRWVRRSLAKRRNSPQRFVSLDSCFVFSEGRLLSVSM